MKTVNVKMSVDLRTKLFYQAVTVAGMTKEEAKEMADNPAASVFERTLCAALVSEYEAERNTNGIRWRMYKIAHQISGIGQ